MNTLLTQVAAVWGYIVPILAAIWAAIAAAATVSWVPWVAAAFAAGKAINGKWGQQTGGAYGRAVVYAVGAFAVVAAVVGIMGGG